MIENLYLVYIAIKAEKEDACLFISLHRDELDAKSKVDFLVKEGTGVLKHRKDVKNIIETFENSESILINCKYAAVPVDNKQWFLNDQLT